MKMDDKLDDEMMDESECKEKRWKNGEHESHKEKEYNPMAMKDVAECLRKDFPEEIADSEKYLRMAKIADNADAHHDSHYLLEMAKDEYTHVEFIHDFMERYGMDIPEEQEMCYNKLKDKMADFF